MQWRVMMNLRRRFGRCPRHGVARCAGLGQTLLVVGPQRVMVDADVVEVIPRVNAGGVTVGERGLQRVIADRLDGAQIHIALAHLQGFLPRPMAAHFGRRAHHAQKFERIVEARTIRKRHLEAAAHLMHLDIGGER